MRIPKHPLRLVAVACLSAMTFTPASAGLYFRVPAAVTVTSVSGGTTNPGGPNDPAAPATPYVVTASFARTRLSTESLGTVQVKNGSNRSYSLGPAKLSGPAFSSRGSDCPTALPAKGICSYVIAFRPTSSGQNEGLFTVSAGSYALTTALTGEGYPTASVTSATLGKDKNSAWLSVAGSALPADTAASIAPAGTASVSYGSASALTVLFSKAAEGQSTAYLTFPDGQPSINLGSYDLTSLMDPAYWVPGVFGSIYVGGTQPRTFSLQNPGTRAITLTNPQVTGAGFSNTSGLACSTIAAGENCNFNLSFTPTAAGTATGTFSVTAGGNVITTSFSATGYKKATAAISSVVKSGSNVVASITGTDLASGTKAYVSPYGYAPVSWTDSSHLTVTYSPTAAAPKATDITLVFADGQGNLVLGAPSLPASLTTSSSTLDFGSVDPDTTATKTLVLTVTNEGDASTSAITKSLTGDASFAVSPASTWGPELSGGVRGSFSLTYSPSTSDVATKTGTLTISSGSLTKVVALTGAPAAGTDPYYANVVTLLHGDSSPVVNSKGGATATYGTDPFTAGVGRFGAGALVFGKTANSAVTAPAFNPTGSFTVEGWIFPTAYGSHVWSTGGVAGLNWQSQDIISDGSNKTLRYWASSNNASLNITGSAGISFGTLNLNEWSHFALVRDQAAGQYRLYLNGVLGNTITTSLQPYGSGYNQVFGNYAGNSSPTNFSSPWYGRLDEFRITNSVARYSGSTHTVPQRAFPDR